MPPDDARYAALRAMDGIEQRKEDCRDTRRVRPIEDLLKDIRFALRAFRRSPVFTITAVVSLALGIGANTTIFTAIDAMLWKPLRVEKPEQLVRFVSIMPSGRESNIFPPDFADRLKRSPDLFSDAIGFRDDGLSFIYDGRAERILGGAVPPNYFTFLGVRTILGEPFSTGVREGHWAAEAVLGYRFWKNRFGGDPGVIGRVIHLNSYPFTIVGVSAPEFYDLERGLDLELRVPRMPPGQQLKEMDLISGTSKDWCLTMARLRPGATLAQASAIAETQFHDILRAENAPEDRRSRHVRALPGDRGWSQYMQAFSTPLFVLFGLVGGVLLIACANVASMLLARATSRRRELAVRCSVGAGRGRLIRQMLAESMLLAIGGGVLGIAAAYWTGPILLHFLPRSNINLVLDLHPDARALWFTFALSVATGVLFGLIPALHATRGDLAGTLKADSAASIGDRRTALFRKALVSAQVGFSLVLLIAAGLFVRTAANLHPEHLGVDPNRVLQFMIKPQVELYDAPRMHTLVSELLRRIREVPGVESDTLGHPGPFTGHPDMVMASVPGHAPVRIDRDDVNSGFVHTFGLRLITGREFTDADKPGSTPVAIVNQLAARALFGNENPIGKTFQVESKGPEGGAYQVIGVIADTTWADVRDGARPMAIFCFQKYPPYMPVVHVRTNNPDTAAMFSAVRRVFDEVDQGFPVFNVKTMSMQIDDLLARERIVANFAAAFGMLALVLAAIGLYGVLAYSVARRTREIGIRMALGSGAGPMVWLVAKEALRLVAMGCAAGIAIAIAAGRLIASNLYGVSPMDPLTLVGAAALMLAIAAIAVGIPAMRATRVDPLIALRYE